MELLVQIANAVISIISVSYLANLGYRYRITLTSCFGVVIIASNVFGMSLLGGVLKNHLLGTGNVTLFFDERAYIRQAICMWVVVAIWLVGARLVATRSRPENAMPRSKRFVTVAGMALLTLGFIAWLPYMVRGPGIDLAIQTDLFTADFGAAMRSRSEASGVIVTGAGFYRALLSSTAMFPLAAALFACRSRTSIVFWCFWIVCFAASVAFFIGLRQKSPVLIAFIEYIGIACVVALPPWRALPRLFRYAVYGMPATVIAGLTLMYRLTEGGDLLVNVAKSLARVFVTPVASAHIWFYTFPEMIPFRGELAVFGVASPASAAFGEITVRDVALIATGVGHSANASFAAVAWSGMGFGGVVAVSLLTVCLFAIVDQFLCRLRRQLFWVGFALSLPLAPVLASTAFLDVILSGVLFSIVGYSLIVCGNSAPDCNRHRGAHPFRHN